MNVSLCDMMEHACFIMFYQKNEFLSYACFLKYVRETCRNMRIYKYVQDETHVHVFACFMHG